MSELVQLYKKHLERIINYSKDYMAERNLAEIWFHYGDHVKFFNDDQEKNFRANPFAVYLINEPNAVGSYIRVTKDGEVTLFNFQDLGFWNVPVNLKYDMFEESGLIKVVNFSDTEVVLEEIRKHINEAQIISPNFDKALQIGFRVEDINPMHLIKDLEELRLRKTEYEYEMLCQAQYLAIFAHRALKNAVIGSNLSENQLLGVYLQNAQLPYDKQGYNCIISYNRNAAILHYNVLDFEPPKERKSFLVDAGAVFQGYQADISRTYCLDGNQLFNDLILGVSNIKEEIIQHIKPGVFTSELQTLMLQKTAELLKDANILRDVGIDEAVDLKIPQMFVPHGFGHSMGIGVHDVMGRPKVEQKPGLRATHELQVGNVWTVEPGIYFIDELIKRLADDPKTAKYVDFELVQALHPYGGIRIEDNVMLQETQLINFTGDLESI